jgi:hypothetical protein
MSEERTKLDAPDRQAPEHDASRRDFVTKIAYVTPAILTLPAAPAYAKYGSGPPVGGDNEKGKDGIIRQGLLETMAQQLKVDTGGAEILRQDPINVIDTPVGMIAARYTVGADTRLTQRALVQGTDKEDLYFILDFITPAPRTGTLKRLARDLAPGPAPLAERVASMRLHDATMEPWEDVSDPAGGDIDVFLECASEISGLLHEVIPRLASGPAA